MMRIIFTFGLLFFGVYFVSFGNNLSLVNQIELSGEVIPLTNNIEAQYYQNNIKFYLKTEQSDEISYRIYHKLSDKNIRSPIRIKGEFLHIHSLKAGYDYTIELFRNDKLAETYLLIIELPWWKTWRFALIWIVILVLFFLTRERTFHFHNLSKQKANDLKISELEIQALQLQMNPHFISNTLNSIQNYIISRDKLTAAEYLSKFSRLIRKFLESSRSKYINLSHEIELISTYVELEQLRFSDKFDFVIEIDKTVDMTEEIPTMILQPYVENAINHGLRNKIGKGLLKITIKTETDFIIISIQDDGVGRQKAREFKTKCLMPNKSLSLKIIEERIKIYQLSGSKIFVSVEDFFKDCLDDCGTIVVFRFTRQ